MVANKLTLREYHDPLRKNKFQGTPHIIYFKNYNQIHLREYKHFVLLNNFVYYCSIRF